MRLASTLVVLLGLFYGSGCATVMTGRYQTITITSEPSGAKVRSEAGEYILTPGVLNLQRDSDHVLVAEYEGCEPQQKVVRHGLQGWLFGNVLLGGIGIVGGLVDFASGSSDRLVPNKVHFDFSQSGQEMVQRQREYLKSHPDTKGEIQVAIENQLAIKGMTREQLIASLGVPDQITEEEGYDKFTYKNRDPMYYLFKNGILEKTQEGASIGRSRQTARQRDAVKKESGPSWEAVRQTDTIKMYGAYLKADPNGPHAAEAKERVKVLTTEMFPTLKEIGVIVEPSSQGPANTDASAIRLAIEDSLRQRGYSISRSDSCEAKFLVSVSRICAFQGTSVSYWHPMVLTEVQIAFEHSDYGRLFDQTYRIESPSDGNTTFKFSDITVVPLSASQPTFINPAKGTVWGYGVRSTLGSSGQDATTTAKALRQYDWNTLGSQQSVLPGLQRELEKNPPTRVTDSTTWDL